MTKKELTIAKHYNDLFIKLTKVYKEQGRYTEEGVINHLDQLIKDYGLNKASDLINKVYNQYFD